MHWTIAAVFWVCLYVAAGTLFSSHFCIIGVTLDLKIPHHRTTEAIISQETCLQGHISNETAVVIKRERLSGRGGKTHNIYAWGQLEGKGNGV